MEGVYDLAVGIGYANMLNQWVTVPRTCFQVRANGTFHIQHDPNCTKDHKEEEQ